MSINSKRMKGKVVFVTGASEGIGRASAVRLAEEGAHVVICARRPKPLAEAQAAIRELGGAAEAIALDVSKAGEFAEAIEDTAKKYRRLDGLVNNAASLSYGSLIETSVEAWRRDFAVNADAVFTGMRAALRIMYGQRSGSIVNIASLNGTRAMPGMS